MKKIDQNWVKNSLGYDNNLFIYQDKTMFNYSVDTILLANLTTLTKRTKRVLEIGANNGALSIFFAQRSNLIKIDAIEIQEKAAHLAQYNVKLNNLNHQINIINQDFNLWWKEYIKNRGKKYDVIICNPPFYRQETKSKKGVSQEMLIATHEIKINLEQIIIGSSKLIQQKGYLSIIIPPERIVDCFYYLRKHHFEPKRVIMIHPRINQKAILTFIEARFQTGAGVHFEPNIYLHPEDVSKHEYLEDVVQLYQPKKV